VLEGSVRRAGERVRINAQLIDGTTGAHVWAERYERDYADIFAVQDQVIEEIVGALSVQLTDSEHAQVTHLHAQPRSVRLLPARRAGAAQPGRRRRPLARPRTVPKGALARW
jgi:hypothetical protein